MTDASVELIAKIVEHDDTISSEQRAAIMRVVRGKKSKDEFGKWISTKDACKLLGTCFGKPVSRAYLKSLVDAERLHPRRFSVRKTVYNEDELLVLLESQDKKAISETTPGLPKSFVS